MGLWLWSLLFLGCAERLSPPDTEQRERGGAPKRWAALLQEAVTPEGRTHYALIQQRRAVLDDYMRWIARHGPVSDDISLSQEDTRIAALANAYNAAVVYAVLERWPLQSVRDVQVGLYRYPPGAGFFLGQTFRIDGEWMDLYFLEHQYLLGTYEDPFIHVMLNCASEGCPPLRYWESKDLDAQQQAALRDYLASPRGLRATEDGGWAASELFLWFEDQLVDWSEAEDVCGFLAPYAPEGEPRAWLEEQQGRCVLRTFPYDWSLNTVR